MESSTKVNCAQRSTKNWSWDLGLPVLNAENFGLGAGEGANAGVEDLDVKGGQLKETGEKLALTSARWVSSSF